jgi:hypothetical protein
MIRLLEILHRALHGNALSFNFQLSNFVPSLSWQMFNPFMRHGATTGKCCFPHTIEPLKKGAGIALNAIFSS